MSKRIQLNTIDLGGGTTKGCDCEAPDLSAYAKKEDVPTKISELENDSGFVTKVGGLAREEEDGTYLNNIDRVVLEKISDEYYAEAGNVYFTPHFTSVYENGNEINVNVLKGKVYGLGTAAYKNVEDLQGDNMTLVKEDVGEVDGTTYIYKSESNRGNKIFALSYSITNYISQCVLVDNDGQHIAGVTECRCVTQEQISIDTFKINVYFSEGKVSIYFSNKPIGYICLGEYTGVMPTAAEGTEDKVTYSIKEYA